MYAACFMERCAAKRSATSANHALWDRCHILGRESILRHRMMHMTGMVAQREQSPGDAGKILQQVNSRSGNGKRRLGARGTHIAWRPTNSQANRGVTGQSLWG